MEDLLSDWGMYINASLINFRVITGMIVLVKIDVVVVGTIVVFIKENNYHVDTDQIIHHTSYIYISVCFMQTLVLKVILQCFHQWFIV